MAAPDSKQTAEKLLDMDAAIHGWYGRTVRLAEGKYALCTSTYNYSQNDETKNEIARRLAALWNIAQGVPTSDLEALAASGFKLRNGSQ